MDNSIEEFVRELNRRSLFIPTLDGFSIEEKNDHSFRAVDGHGMTEVFSEEDVFDSNINNMINKALNDSIDFLAGKDVDLRRRNIKFYKDIDYNFKFRVYFDDLVLKNTHFIRDVKAYFIDPRNNTFNLITLSIGPLEPSKSQPLLGDIDGNFQDDSIVKILLERLDLILRNVKYND